MVKEPRTNPGFSFVGWRFNDQMLRTYAGENVEALGPRFAALAAAVLTKAERSFLAASAAIRLIDVPRRTCGLALSAETRVAKECCFYDKTRGVCRSNVTGGSALHTAAIERRMGSPLASLLSHAIVFVNAFHPNNRFY
ncbi:hypothetical protein CO655_32690 [Rhizobium sp. M1]|nr:hypothetical protein CO655_32690 [Rhizobium sp. M1]